MDTARKTVKKIHTCQINIPKGEVIITEYSEIIIHIHFNTIPKLVGDNTKKLIDQSFVN